MKLCMRQYTEDRGWRRKSAGVSLAGLLLCGLLAAGFVSDVEAGIQVGTASRSYRYENMEGAVKEVMTEAYARTVYDAEDYNTLCRIVEAEASGEDMKGKIMVANVILNRVEHPSFPDTVRGVVYASGQFSPVSSGKINRVRVSAETEEAVRRALSGEDYSCGALYFAARSFASSSNMGWFDRSLTKVAAHGGHEFFM